MKKEKVIERVLDYLKNHEFYEALFKEIEADIQKDLERARKKNKNPGYLSHK